VDHIGLGGKQLPLQTSQQDLAMRLCLTGIDRRVGAVEGVEQLVAELGHEVLQADVEQG